MEITNQLRTLGLDDKESSVYIALVKTGSTSAGEIIKQTCLHRELVYGALQRLEQKNLVRSFEKQKIRHFSAENPDVLVANTQKSIEIAKQTADELKKMYQQPGIMVRIYEGSAGFEEIQRDIQLSLKNNDEYNVIGAAGSDWYHVTEKFYLAYRKKCLKRNIHCQMITFANEKSAILKKEPSGFARVKTLPQNFAVPSSTKIYADKIVLQVFGEQPVAIQIQSKAISKSYREYFQTLWKITQ